jgi:uncharacterized protein DUF4159
MALSRTVDRRIVAALLAAMFAAASIVDAQSIIRGGRRGQRPRFATMEDLDGGFSYCRAYYNSVYNTGSGSGWDTDYPAADNNFSVRLAELTRVPVTLGPERQPRNLVIRLDDPVLFHCPLLFIEDTGGAEFTTEEVLRLREYLLKGGFLWMDDSWGSENWNGWIQQISRVLPPGEFPVIDIPVTHQIMHTLYDVKEVPQIPSINFWYRSNGQTSENGSDSARVFFKGIQDREGHLMVVMSHNTDIADSWEREGDNREFFDLFSPRGYAIGVNVVVYALTH